MPLDHASAALAAAHSAGLAVERGEVVHVAANVLVRLEPPPVAARLTGVTEGFRDPEANLRREARLAGALARAGAPVVAPLAGPIAAGGRVVTLWPWVDVAGHAGDAAHAGRALRACHDALEALDGAGTRRELELEPLAMLTEARRLAAKVGSDTSHVVLAVIERALATLGAARAHRIVHGDSHPGNVLWTAGGPLWSDWEDAHLAPLEWDLACLVAGSRTRGDDFGWGEAALAAHGGPYDEALLDACVDARVAQGAAYLAATGRGDAMTLQRHLDWLSRGGR